MKKTLLILLVFSISLACLLIATEANTFDLKKYLNSFDKHDTMDVTGKSFRELGDITNDLFEYLRGKSGDEILEPNFNEREILHMRDVQVLFKYGFILKYVSVILALAIIIYFRIKRDVKIVGRYMYKGLFANWILVGILGLMVYFNFDKYFTIFHKIFFSNDLWLLNPETDLLIQMLPEEFFISMAISIMLSFLGFVATIQGIGYATARKEKGNSEKKFKWFKRDSKD
ncbi:TIGR01906 family membrane protein [Tissierella sp.]|uniref:TIGR01906 family membrane protein n=1 Tax=Tissierella sp. TaxID=41274 RepID=UPI00285E4D63|nr:TIGR01906 family membrane protein [Tissierella sp.]MDR7857167.1 TIGR01906 family membrane protein [Tissierella sp.]